MRSPFRAFLILLLLLAPVAPAKAQSVSLEAEAGFEGRYKAGARVPVTVILRNAGADLEGELRYSMDVSMGMGKHVGEYRVPVTVPAGATRRLPLYLSTEGSQIPTIKLIVGEKEEASVKPALEVSRDLLVGVLGAEPSDLPGLAGAALEQGRNIRLIRLTPESLPAEPLALESLDLLLLDRFAFSELPTEKQRAVQAWVEFGGTLVGAAGPEGKRLEGLAPWVPVAVGSEESLPVDGVGKAPLAHLTLSGDWTVTRTAAGGLPLTAAFAKGEGRVWLWAFDPALEPFASWSGLPGLLAETASRQTGPFMGNPGMGMPSPTLNLANALAQFPLKEIPATRRLLEMLALYALLLGPVHLLALRAFRKLGWALLTLPLLAAAGAGGAWAYLKQSRVSDVMVTSLSVIEGEPGSGAARVRTVAGVTMPPGAARSVALGDALLMPVPAPLMGMGPIDPAKPPETRSLMGQGRSARLSGMDTWALRAIGARALVGGAGSVEGSVIMSDGKAEGRLTSRLSFPLKEAVLVINSNFQKLGDLKPGESAEISMSISGAPTTFMGKGGPANSLVETVNRASQFGGFGPGGPTPEQYQQMRRQQMVWAGLSGIPWAQTAGVHPVVLMGWTDWQPLPVAVDGEKISASAMSMYVQPVSFDFPQGEFSVPPGLLSMRLVSMQGQQAGMMVQQLMPGWSLPRGGSATVEFDVPRSLRGRVEHLEYKLQILNGTPPSYPMRVEMMHWPSGEWRSVAMEGGTASLPGGGGWISGGGIVRVRMTKLIEEPVPMGVPTLGLSGTGVR